jgi:hypothetical protein
LCNIARSSDDWQYMAVDCLIWLVQDANTCHKVISSETMLAYSDTFLFEIVKFKA